ncbi:MAG: acyl-phosphate glycerol 3-phosphate acyltransferase [Rhodospirillales bacterium]|nr:acyl-phosphate glycerol 3-phosphate acyltransferase [Rhodospirillales bacterium]
MAVDANTRDQDQRRTVETAERLLAVAHALITEINPRRAATLSVALDSRLDKDLGLDSLGRVELMARVEQVFDVTLAEEAMAAAETPRDMLRAVLAAEARGKGWAPPEVSALALAETGELPTSARTLIEVLRWHARRNPERPHIRLYADEGDGEVITYRDLEQGAERIAAALRASDVKPDEAVALMLPTGRDYFISFFGVLLAGAVPAPLYPPARLTQAEDHLRRYAGVIDNCRAGVLITSPEVKPFAQLLGAQVPSLRAVTTLVELTARGGAFVPIARGPEETAFLQYTSGSTGNPKGVVLTHANLLANVRAMGEAVRATSADVFVSWLPLYHDMGLIGAWFGSLYHAMPLVVMAPMAFIARPERWLRAIHRFRGTLSAAPNFAYELCLKRIDAREIAALDLSCWRAAFNGAEAVNPDTLERFAKRFAPAKLKPESLMPVYGLAENSVGLAFPPLGRAPMIDRVARETFMRSGRAVPAGADEPASLRFPACGQPIPGHQIRVADANDRELPERIEGRIQFKGPSATSGYFRRPEETRKLFCGDWLETGDRGYLANGDIHITGRTKDMIIRAGRNIYPVEIEEAVGALAGVRAGNVAVFGMPDPQTGTERLVVLAETRSQESARDEMRAAITAIVTDLAGGPPDEVVLAPPNTVLKTSSGKIRRAATRELYERGAVGQGRPARWRLMARMALASLVPRTRRLAATLTEASYAGYAWTLAVLAAMVVVPIFVVIPTETARWPVMRAGLRILARLAGIPITVRGIENLPPEGTPCVFVANHASYLDSFVLAAAIPRSFSFIAKAELAGQFLPRLLLGRIGAEYVRRLNKEDAVVDAKRIVARAKAGRNLMYFPEGTLIRAPGLLPFRLGAFEAAAAAQVPLIPIALRGTRSILRDESWFPRRGAIAVTVEPAIDPAALTSAAGVMPQGVQPQDPWKAALRLRDLARERILRHCGEPDASHVQLPF